MQNIIAFFIRNRNFFVFIALLSLSLFFTFQTHSYHRSKFINSANWLSGGVYGTFNNITAYFHLKDQNKTLLEENKKLRKLLLTDSSIAIDSIVTDSSNTAFKYHVYSAPVIKNSYGKTKNYITIKGGSKQGIKQDFGVITSNGIVGIVENTSSGYAVVQSVLNTISQINAQLKNTSHFGTLIWDAKNYKTVQLIDIPDIAPVHIGDTIITGGMSTIFPKGILIGTVSNFTLDSSENYYIIDVDLSNDMTDLASVYVIENTDKEEIEELEQRISNE